MLNGKRMLGLAFEERAILAAEIRLSGARAHVLRGAELSFPEGVSLEDPQRLGQALREFLRTNGFSARSAVAGVPARWLLSKLRTFPPAASSALAGMARLEAERSFAIDVDRLVLDYADGPASEAGRQILLAALPQDKAAQLAGVCAAAGLKLKVLTITSMVLAAARRPDSRPELLLYVRPAHSELCIRAGDGFRTVKHLPLTMLDQNDPAAWAGAAANEIGRLMATLPHEGSINGLMTLVVRNDAGLSTSVFESIGEQLSVKTEADGAFSGGSIAQEDARFAPAAELALAGTQKRRLPLDFLHSRITVAAKSKSGRRVAWGAAAAAVALAVCVAVLADGRAKQRELDGLRLRLKESESEINTAQAVVDQFALARGWTQRRPRFLDPLRELTLAFPVQGRIWVTSLAIREDMHTVVTGKASSEQAVLDTLDQIRGSSAFDGVKLLYMREAGGSDRSIAFSITFAFADRK